MTTPELKVIETNAAEEFDLSRFKSKRELSAPLKCCLRHFRIIRLRKPKTL